MLDIACVHKGVVLEHRWPLQADLSLVVQQEVLLFVLRGCLGTLLSMRIVVVAAVLCRHTYVQEVGHNTAANLHAIQQSVRKGFEGVRKGIHVHLLEVLNLCEQDVHPQSLRQGAIFACLNDENVSQLPETAQQGEDVVAIRGACFCILQ